DTPDDLIHDLFAAQMWEGHPLGRPILGTREAVTGDGRGIVLGHFGEEYVPPRIMIAVAGNATHARVVDLFGTHFDGFQRAPVARSDTPATLKPGVNIVQKTLEQVHVILGFPGLHHSASERYALFLLNDVIGGSMSSRLFQEVRERQGLVYSVHSSVQAYADTGTLYIYAATDAPNFSKVLKSTLKEIRDLKKHGVTAEELRRSKDHLKGSLMLSLESTSSRMNRLAKHEMHHGSFVWTAAPAPLPPRPRPARAASSHVTARPPPRPRSARTATSHVTARLAARRRSARTATSHVTARLAARRRSARTATSHVTA